MTSVLQTWAKRATIGGTVTSFLDAHIAYGARSQTVGTCSLSIPLPLPLNVTIGATVIVEASLNGAWLSTPLFTGSVRQIDNAVTASGATVTVSCDGPAHRLTYPIGRLVHAGGARAAPQTVVSAAHHIGTATITWYADDVGEGTEVDFPVAPAADSSFVWVAGKLHGTNSYDTSVGQKKTKSWSRVDVYQSGSRLGYANLPVSQENYTDHLDYTVIANWEDFEVFIAAPIRLADGTVTFKFRSGKKPGTSSNDDYEIQSVTWQTAGKQSLRQMIRGFCKRAGLTTAQYDVYEITDLGGSTIRLGGNGLVDAGQVVIDEREQPSAFIGRILDLFGFVLFDSPDGVVRVRPFRGIPSGTAVQTFTEGDTILGVPSVTIDPRSVYNEVLVEGASGNDQAGARFAYTYRTPEASEPPSVYIPSPPTDNMLTLSSSLLVSDTLCQQAGEVAETNNFESQTISWETWPHVLRPAQVAQINAPTAGYTGKVLVDSIRYDIDASGYRMSVTGWQGSTYAITETPDPDPAEVDTEPVDPRPSDEWQPYNPLAAVQ